MKILYVEDNQMDIDLTLWHLKKNAPHIKVDTVLSQAAALNKIKDSNFSDYDLVLSDMQLQDGDGIALLSYIRSHSIPVAVVILTGQGDEESAVSALKSGADDYIIKKKGYLESLPLLLESALDSYRKGNERKISNLRVLYIEHNHADIDLTSRHLKKHAVHITLEPVYSINKFYEMLDNTSMLFNYDVLLLDYRLPQENALEVLRRIRLSKYSKIPVILVTGKGDEEIAVNALKLGAFDYVTKNRGYLFKLPSIIENAFYNRQLTQEHDALIESENRYRSLFENNNVAILLTDPDNGQIVDANPAASLFYGWSREELTAKKIDQINILSPKEISAEIRAASTENRNHFLFRHKCADGTIRDVEVYSGKIEVRGRALIYSLTYDVTERIKMHEEKLKLQEQLVHAQKMEAIGTLAGGIAHDFNNILSAILGYTEMAKEDAPPGSQFQEDLEQVLIAANRAKDLVKQILAFSRQAKSERIPINIHPLINEGLKMLRSSIPTTISIVKNIDPKTSIILAVPTQIHQILMNLCTNAYHAMENTGGILSVTLKNISIEPADLSRMLLKVNPGKYIQFSVSDTGQGIGPDVIDKIFNPYFTTKEIGKGTGMGLAIIH
ncbi:MAG: response regulator, partial [Desulfamplus sp.]|nr:response regulator [Desulfamplus sp.]